MLVTDVTIRLDICHITRELKKLYLHTICSILVVFDLLHIVCILCRQMTRVDISRVSGNPDSVFEAFL